jgi:tetratricopeptide (TPR) repeat protein
VRALDSRTVAVGALAVLLAAGLGGLAGGTAGVPAGVLTAMAGLASSAVLAVAVERRARNAARAKRRQKLLKIFACPVPVADPEHGGDDGSEAGAGDVARYLRPEEAVVRFRDRPELTRLLDWCAGEQRVAVRLVTGSGGAGKTRLALQLTVEMAGKQWQPLWVPRGREGETAAAVRDLGQRCVLVVDYAETRDGLDGLLGELAGWEGPLTRIVLLARSAGEWWQNLTASTGDRVARLLEDPPVTLGPLPSSGGQAEVFSEAVTAFAARLPVARPAATLVLEDPELVVLVVHAAALLAVLDQYGGDVAIRSSGEVLDRLLEHEARYWAQSAAARGLALDTAVQRRAVAVGCLIGAGSEAAAVRLLACVPDLADSRERRGQVARWLHDLYPENRIGYAGSGEWIGPLRPDLVAERLVVSELSAQRGLIAELFAGLDEDRAAQALTVLARAALTQPAGLDLLRDALTAHSGDLALPAMSVAVETNPAVGDLLSEALTAGSASTQVMERIADAAPYPSFALAPVAATVLAQLIGQVTDAGPRASRLLDLSNRLADLGRPEEALKAINEAVVIRRELARVQPDAFLPYLARSLTNQSNCLAAVGRREEALAAINEAVTIHRELARARPDAFLPDLAASLTNQCGRLGELGRREEALAAINEAVTVRRELARAWPDAFLPDLAASLNNQSIQLGEMGREEEALAAINEAVTAYRDLARSRPDAFLPDLARSRNDQSNCLAALGRWEEALAPIDEAVTIRRDLARSRPDAFLPGLATSLNNQSNCLGGLGQGEEALAVIDEAVTIHRDLARSRPDAFLPDLAASLNNQSIHLGGLGRQEEALAPIDEAVTIHRDLARSRPDAFLPDLARSLSLQSALLGDLGRQEEALAPIDEAVTVYRDLARSRPVVFGSWLSRSLDHLAGLLSALGRNTEADAVRAEAESVRPTM